MDGDTNIICSKKSHLEWKVVHTFDILNPLNRYKHRGPYDGLTEFGQSLRRGDG